MSIVKQLRGDWYLVIGNETLEKGKTAVLSIDGKRATISDQPGVALHVRECDCAVSVRVTRTMLVVIKPPSEDEHLTAQANVFWTIPGDPEELIEPATLLKLRGEAGMLEDDGQRSLCLS